MGYNKLIYGGVVKFDLTADTVEPSSLLVGATAHDKAGELIEGTCDFDVNSSDADVAVAEILYGKTAYARGTKLTGTMPNIGKQASTTISTKAGSVTISQGYHDGSAKVSISTTEQNKIIAGNIKNGVTILGVQGTYTGESTEKPQANKNVTPTTSQQVITPDTGYTCLSQVTVAAIPYSEASNSAGGTTITIG